MKTSRSDPGFSLLKDFKSRNHFEICDSLWALVQNESFLSDCKFSLLRDYNCSDHSGALNAELGTIQALRRELEEGVDRNNKMRRTLDSLLREASQKERDHDGEIAEFI